MILWENIFEKVRAEYDQHSYMQDLAEQGGDISFTSRKTEFFEFAEFALQSKRANKKIRELTRELKGLKGHLANCQYVDLMSELLKLIRFKCDLVETVASYRE